MADADVERGGAAVLRPARGHLEGEAPVRAARDERHRVTTPGPGPSPSPGPGSGSGPGPGPGPGPGGATPLDASVDALSDVLELIHLRGGELARVRTRGAEQVRHGAGERVLHLVERGPVELAVTGGERIRLDPGDLALLATGAAHALRATGGVSGAGGAGAGAGAWLSGRFLVEEKEAAPLLAVLPPAIVLRGSAAGLDWLPVGAGLLAAEVADPSAGSQVMVSRILDLLFIRALRAWAESAAPLVPGLLTAALDRPLGPVLRALHRHPERPWSVTELADLAALSRAAFTARFVRLVGEPPARHLARLRLARAADRLATTAEPVGTIGRTVGYASEAAFSRAFTRAYGCSPRAWRTTSGTMS
ncbi:AraC family transcriptional regulator [Streptomyces sp. NPDC090025]|uniref:AraC family transcriptional regulator n=1 Tax=Streptomyces sp. NPDC090025 TaxID=3365922 RepID=UPI003832BC9B